jgi:hypothetical protein
VDAAILFKILIDAVHQPQKEQLQILIVQEDLADII